MLNFYADISKGKNLPQTLGDTEKFSIYYHNIFDYPLNFADLIKWNAGKGFWLTHGETVIYQNGFFTLRGKEGLIYKRSLRERISAHKLEIAKKASKILSFIPGIKMVAVTGSLAMANSSEESDIDLLIITRRGGLWTTRALAYSALWLFGIQMRRPFEKDQKDKLCLNMWMDESDLIWKNPRNVYTAHEIGQILPLVNKNQTYEKFLWKNKWILAYWPNAIKIGNWKLQIGNSRGRMSPIEWIAYKIQLIYMRGKVTRETITPTRAIFHPNDWGKVVLSRLNS
jgi:predicted nucleotidyltransferase